MNTDVITNFESIKQIDSSNLTDKDTSVIAVDVGNMPSHKIQEYLENLIQQFRRQEVIPE